MIKGLIVSVFFGILLFAGLSVTVEPTPTFACGEDTSDNFLGIIPPWHYYITCADLDNNTLELNDMWSIGFALLLGLTRAAGVAAVVFILWGGIKYITSQGSPDGTASARKTIINAIAGLVIAASSSTFVSFAFQTVGGGNLGQSSTRGDNVVRDVLGVVYTIVGAVAVIYVIIGAIKFATSTGDPGKAASARNTIIYAIVGLVVAIAAGTITNFVIGEI